MSAGLLFSIIESPTHPDFSRLYAELGLTQRRLTSQRKAIQALKREPPDWVVAEFFYGFGNNYAGANVSNLDVFLRSQQRYAPRAKVIILVNKDEAPHLDALTSRFNLHGTVRLPGSEAELEALLQKHS